MRAGVRVGHRADGAARADQPDWRRYHRLLRDVGGVGRGNGDRGRVPAAVLAVLDSVRLSAWLMFGIALVTTGGDEGTGHKRGYLIARRLYCALAIATDVPGPGPGPWRRRPVCANAGTHRFRRPGPADDRKPVAQHRSSAALACMAGVSGSGSIVRLRALPVFGCLHHPRPGRPGLGARACGRGSVCGAAIGSGDGAQPRMAGRHPCFSTGCAAHRDTVGERLLSVGCCRRRRCCCAGSAASGGLCCSWRCCSAASSYSALCSLRGASGSASNF